jgi:DNA processing protein
MPNPQTDAERLAWLRLSRSRNVGSRSFQSLMGRYGGAGAALDALPDLAARGARGPIRPVLSDRA